MNSSSLKNSSIYINKAIKKAQQLNVEVNIAVVDSAGFLIVFKRMDKALLGAIDIAITKAKTAALFQKASHI